VANELILVVEDNDKNRKLVRDVLTFKGYAIIEARPGKRASASPKSATRVWS
jgi:CheY-like chemotaxis protein